MDIYAIFMEYSSLTRPQQHNPSDKRQSKFWSLIKRNGRQIIPKRVGKFEFMHYIRINMIQKTLKRT